LGDPSSYATAGIALGVTHNQIDHILIGDGIQVYFMSDHSGQQAAILTTICLVVAKVRERMTVRKQTTYRVHMERFNLKKLMR
jgi:hypothetical protein